MNAFRPHSTIVLKILIQKHVPKEADMIQGLLENTEIDFEEWHVKMPHFTQHQNKSNDDNEGFRTEAVWFEEERNESLK